MSNCQFFPKFCINDKNDDVDICVFEMSKYFGFILKNNSKLYCCQKCLVAVQSTFSSFIDIHEDHLEAFISKTKIVIIKDYLEQLMQVGLGKKKASQTNSTLQIEKLKHCPTSIHVEIHH